MTLSTKDFPAGGTRRKRVVSASILALALALTGAACGDDDGGNGDAPDAAANDTADASTSNAVDVTADISADTTWTSDKVYTLKDNIFVRGATLTVEAGTLVVGDNGSSLVITNTAQLVAVGTASEPIVFTSSKAAGARAAGDWGGIVLLGKASINITGGTDNIEGFPAGTAGTEFGGTDDAHKCGELKYVRIEFAGFELSVDNELNGLTVGACGTGTVLDYIQVHKGADDGIEFFGGTAGLKHTVITQADDDGLDWDSGWRGDAQFIIVQQSGTTGNMGMECDNNGNANDATPRSAPTIWNATLIGSNSEPGMAFKTQGAMMLRRGTAGLLNNFVVAYFTDYAVDVAGYASAQQTRTTPNPALTIENSYFFDNANDAQMGWPTNFDVKDTEENDCETANTNCFDEMAFFTNAARSNTVADPQLEDALNLTAPNFAPKTGSPVLSGGGTPGSGFDASATFIGAIGTTDWTAGWTAYPAN